MASNAKRKTTMAKLNREAKLREKRAEKAARKDARKHAAANPPAEPLELDDDGDTADDATLSETEHSVSQPR